MKLSELIKDVEIVEKYNYDENIDVTGVNYNSKTTKAGDIFVCLRGEHVDGHNFAADAVKKGAVAVMCETKLDLDVPEIIVSSAEQSIAGLANRFYEAPSKDLNMIGVTGTNGKTTISTLVYKYLRYNQIGATLIGTNGIYINDAFIETINTTPSMNIIYNILK